MLACRSLFVLGLFLPTACLQNRLTNNQRFIDKRPVVVVECDAEEKLDAFKLRKTVTDYDYKLTPVCAWQDTKEVELNSTHPVRIMLVIDITGSMGASLKEVKSNLIDFSYKLQALGWDAQFGAIGFRDNPDEQQFVDFDFASTLYPMMSSWTAEGGGDLQEAGQFALTKAIEAIQISQKKEARSARGIIPEYYLVYVSDAPMYAGDDHHDFTVDTLASKLKDTGIHLIYAIDKATDPEAHGLKAAKPIDQMADLIAQSQVESKSLSYPIQMADLLTGFTKEFTSVSRRVPMNCTLTRVELSSDPSSKGVPATATLDNLDQGDTAEHLQFSALAHDATNKNYLLTTHRHCCPQVEGSIDCNDRVMPIPVQFEDPQAKL